MQVSVGWGELLNILFVLAFVAGAVFLVGRAWTSSLTSAEGRGPPRAPFCI